MVLKDVQDLEAARIEQARDEVGETSVGPRLARTLLVGFLLAVGAVPGLDLFLGDRTSWRELSDRPPREPGAARTWTRAVVEGNRDAIARLQHFEEALEDRSAALIPVRRFTQHALWRVARAGNARVVSGRDGWLFLRDDVDYVTGRGFLEPTPATAHAQPHHAGESRAGDPVSAIVDFRDQLRRRGIALIVVPTPVKPVVEAAALARGAPAPLQNGSWIAFRNAMEEQGIPLVDLAGTLVSARSATGQPQFLSTDTHWRPEGVSAAAELLAASIGRTVPLASAPPFTFVDRVEAVSQHGDLFAMLDLPVGQTSFAPESVRIRRILSVDGQPWRPTRNAEVLLLGDSFTNIYSMSSLGWGTSAGLAEQLSFELRRPIDRITRNDDGAFATRELLAEAERTGEGRLAGVRVLVYQFAMRELSRGDWKRIELGEPPAASGTGG